MTPVPVSSFPSYRCFAQPKSQELMYCTEAVASPGITETMAIQLAQAARYPASEPWEYWPYRTMPPALGNIEPSSE